MRCSHFEPRSYVMKPDGTTDKTRRHLLQTLPVLLGLLLTGCQPGSPQPASSGSANGAPG